ncbi:MAG: ABC transporter ATP-binding protein [Candidatus Aminicenantes bacterium]|nr:MAG: ABC transporter ATP-binding protein [Candidatus Aminicenantes bacterium]
MLEAKDLTIKYEDGLLALDHLNFKVEPGEIFCMFGANGAGKTTTINLFLNFIQPTAGTALIEGIDVTKEPLKSKDYVSFVSENVMLYDNFSAFQNISYFSKLAGKRNLTKDDYTQVFKRVGLQEEAFNMRTRKFSKGMRQKLGIAIAIVKDAPNIILDEPTSGLDPRSGQEFLELLLELRDKGKSIFMSSHDIFRAKYIADNVGFMMKGKMVMMQSKKELKGQDLNKLYVEYMQEHTDSEI